MNHNQSIISSSPSPAKSSSSHDTTTTTTNNTMTDTTHQPMRNYDGTLMRDATTKVIYKSQFLSTHPLKSDCKERVGYAGRKFTYVSGDGVIRTMNAIFGHGGWSSQITMERNVMNEKDDRGRWNVGYLSTVKVTLLNGVSHEDCGSGEGIDNNKVKAHEKAMKSAVTDAMKRAARHFGERLGNALYVKGAGFRTAPRTNKEALDQLERNDALNLFGDQCLLRSKVESPDKKLDLSKTVTSSTNTSATNVINNAGHNQGGKVVNTYTRTSPNKSMNIGQQQAVVMPSPIASTAIHRSSMAASHQVNSVNNGTRVGNNSNGYNNSNFMQQALVNAAPQPPNLMVAPPPRPIYNPTGGNGGSAQYGGGNINHNVKRGLDGIGNQHNMTMGSTNMNNNNTGDSTKRQKVNPYSSNNNNNGRASL